MLQKQNWTKVHIALVNVLKVFCKFWSPASKIINLGQYRINIIKTEEAQLSMNILRLTTCSHKDGNIQREILPLLRVPIEIPLKSIQSHKKWIHPQAYPEVCFCPWGPCGWGVDRSPCSGGQWPYHPNGNAEVEVGWGEADHWAGRISRYLDCTAGLG